MNRNAKATPSPILSRGMLCLLTLFILVLLAEGGARLMKGMVSDPGLVRVFRDFPHLAQRMASGFRFVPDEELSYRLRPDFTLEEDCSLTRHNQQGFRDLDDYTEKQPGTVRVLCVGGSTTYGVGVVDNEATYPKRLEAVLREKGQAAEVLNLGVGGYTTVEVLANLRRHGPTLDPDIVVVQCSINDVPPRFYPGFTCDYSHFRMPLTLPRNDALARMAYQSRFFLLLAYKMGGLLPLTLQDRTQPPWPPVDTMHENLQQNGSDCFEQHLVEIVEAIRDLGARPVLMTQPYLVHSDFIAPDDNSVRFEEAFRIGLKEHTEVVETVARHRDVTLVDLARTMPLLRRHFTDPIHMTETGNATRARLIAEALSPLMD